MSYSILGHNVLFLKNVGTELPLTSKNVPHVRKSTSVIPMFADLHPHVQGPIYIKQNISTIKIFSPMYEKYITIPMFAKVLSLVCKSTSPCCEDRNIIKKHIPNFKLLSPMYEKYITIDYPHVCKSTSPCCGDRNIIKKHIPNFQTISPNV